MQITCRIDSTGLNQGIIAASAHSKRSLPQIVNTSAYWVAVNAKNAMPFVTPERIDQELAVIGHPVIGKRGGVLKKRKRYSGGISPLQDNQGFAAGHQAPLAALIVAARANPTSKYNALTHGRYALAKNPFKGVSRAAGRAAMAALVDRMIKSRHRSPKFLLAGWIKAVWKMAKWAVKKYTKGGGSPSEGGKSFYGGDLGDARPAPATAENYECSAMIENDVGMKGVNAPSFNRALNLYGYAGLQGAVDREGRQHMEYALKKNGEELAAVVKPGWGT